MKNDAAYILNCILSDLLQEIADIAKDSKGMSVTDVVYGIDKSIDIIGKYLVELESDGNKNKNETIEEPEEETFPFKFKEKCLYTTKEVANIFGVSQSTICDRIRDGSLKATKLCGSNLYRISNSELKEFIKRNI